MQNVILFLLALYRCHPGKYQLGYQFVGKWVYLQSEQA